MLRSGLFIDSRGGSYTVYECQDTGYYRLDICSKDAQYHVEPGKVLYSKYKHKDKIYIFGEPKLYDEYLELIRVMTEMKAETNTTNEWVNGKFKLTTQKGTDNNNFMETVLINGAPYSNTYSHNGAVLNLAMDSVDPGLSMAPINLSDYACNELGVDSVASSGSPYIPLNVLKVRYDLKHLEDRDYQYVEGREMFLAAIADIQLTDQTKTDKIVVDTETTGLDVDLYGDTVLVGIIIGPKRKKAWYFPFRHTKEKNLPMEWLDELMRALLKVQDFLLGHNLKYDRKVFYKLGYDLRAKFDSYTLSMLVNPKQGRGLHALKELKLKLSGEKYLEFEDIFVDKSNVNFADLPKDLVVAYACPDGDNPRDVWDWQYDLLPDYERYLLDVELELKDLKADQEYWGFRVNVKKFAKGYDNCQYCKDLLEKMIYTMTRSEFNLNSNEMLSELLYNKMHCKVYVRTKTKRPSTGIKAITKLSIVKRPEPVNAVKTDIRDKNGEILVKAADLNAAQYPVVLLLMKYKEQQKLMSAFYERVKKNAVSHYIQNIGDKSECTRYFAWINPNGAESGRQSSPLHQLPPEIKDDIEADSDDHYMLDTDYCQMELRVLPSLAREISLIEKERDPDADIHRVIGALLTGKEIYQISKKERSKGKRRNFGVVYLISGMGLAIQNVGACPTPADIKEASDSIDEFFHGFPRIREFIRKNRSKVLRDGKMRTLFGRVRYFPQIFDPELTHAQRESLIRQANNLPVQGTSADITKIAETNFDRECRNEGFNKLVETPQGKFPYARCMLSIHDELLTSFHVSIPVEKAMKMNRDAMEINIKAFNDDGTPMDFAPMFAESSVSVNWGEGHGDNFKVPRKFRDQLIAEWERTGVSAVTAKTPAGIRDEMKQLVLKFQEEELMSYMEGLVQKYGTDADAVASHVRHPSLTFDLLDRFPQSKEDNLKDGQLSHDESIRYAVVKFLEYRLNPDVVIKVSDEEKDRVEDEVTKQAYDEIVGESAELVDVDREGNPIYTEGEASEEEDTFMYSDEEDAINYITNGEKNYVWELQDVVCIEADTLDIAHCNELLALVFKQAKKDGFSRVFLSYGGRLMDTQMRVERFDKEPIVNYLKEHEPVSMRSAE